MHVHAGCVEEWRFGYTDTAKQYNGVDHFGFHGDRWKLINTHGHQSTALPCPSPLIIYGAKYSWVPTNDIERALVGFAISFGNGLTWFPISFLGFRSFLDLLEKSRGPKHVVGATQDGWIQEGSMQAGWTQ
jgi:hypothetical protein